MANLWTLKFGIEEKLPILVRSGTNIGSNISFLSNRIYKDLKGPSDPINVINDFQWTKSPKSSRKDVPKVRLIEKRITKNSTVSNLAYSLLANVDLANTLSVQAAAGVDLVSGNDQAAVQNQLQNIKNTGANSIDQTIQNSETLSKIKSTLDENFLSEAFQSDVLKPYNFLYSTEKTGFEYILPYLTDEYRLSNTQMGGEQGSNIVSALTQGVQSLASQVAGTTLALRPGVYIEEAQQFQYSQEGRTINVSIPLLNTGTYDDIIKNWQLLFGLVYQNRPGRITKNLIDVPVIYELFIEGVAYMPYSYITSLKVDFVGNRRTMKIKIPVTKFASEGSDTSVQTREIETTIPDAYQIDIQIKGLNDETRNFMYQSLNGLPVTVKTALPTGVSEGIDSVNNGGPVTKSENKPGIDQNGDF